MTIIKKQFMMWKTLNYACCQKVSETQFASDPSTLLHDQYFQAKVTDLI